MSCCNLKTINNLEQNKSPKPSNIKERIEYYLCPFFSFSFFNKNVVLEKINKAQILMEPSIYIYDLKDYFSFY